MSGRVVAVLLAVLGVLYGMLPNDAGSVHQYTLRNRAGMTVKILDYGGTITEIDVPDAQRRIANVVLGYRDLDGYVHEHMTYFGAILGRFANRIANGTFVLDNVVYRLATNAGPNTLHGGPRGFDKALWHVDRATPNELRLSHVSPDGDQGFPGTLNVSVTYALDERNGLRITTSRRPTNRRSSISATTRISISPGRAPAT